MHRLGILLVALSCGRGEAPTAPLQLEVENLAPRGKFSLSVWGVRLMNDGTLEPVRPGDPGALPLSWLALRFEVIDGGAVRTVSATAPVGPRVHLQLVGPEWPLDGGCNSAERDISDAGLAARATYRAGEDGGLAACDFTFSTP